jgi:hypothetical protein
LPVFLLSSCSEHKTHQLTRQLTVEDPLTEAKDIYRLGCFLLGWEKLVPRPLRLLGLGVASLREPSGQQPALL